MTSLNDINEAVHLLSNATIPFQNRLTRIPYYYAEGEQYLVKHNDNINIVHAKSPFEATEKVKPQIKTAKWKVFDDEKCPQCTSCGMWMPFARYRRITGRNAREVTNFFPWCGAKMIAIDQCSDCPNAENGCWKDSGICYSCREDAWIYGKPIRVYEELKAKEQDSKHE